MLPNIIKLLEKRQVSSWNQNVEYFLAQTLDNRRIRLAAILNRKSLTGHVFLGFSHRGDCIISYLCLNDFEVYRYWLYWWHFDMNKELVLVSKFELFRDEIISNPLYIVMHEDGTNAYVLGCRTGNGMESKPCCVSILPSQSPCKTSHLVTIHFKFELLLPFPCVFMTLDNSLPGCLLLNTGIGLMCVMYEPTSEGPPIVNTDPSAQFTTHDVKCFVMQTSSTRVAVSSSPMAMKVFNKDEQMLLMEVHEKIINSGIVVRESTLDVDSWLSRILPLVLHDEYQCLCDYNMEVIEMDKERTVTFVVVAVVQVSSTTKLQFVKCVMTLVGQWCVMDGSYKLLYTSSLQDNVTSTSKWLRTLSNINKRHYMSTLPYFMNRPLSNRNIFTGKSLEAITHPHLPIVLVL